MLKKICLLIAVLFCLQVSAQSQSKLSFGLKVSPTVAWFNTSHEDVTADGAAVKAGIGAIVNYELSPMFFAVSGINYSTMGGYVSDTESLSATHSYTNYKINYSYVTVPVAVKFRSKPIRQFSYFIEGGLNVGINIISDELRKTDEGKTRTDISSLTNAFRLGAHIGGGVDYPVGKRSTVFGQISLNKAITSSAGSAYTSTGRYQERLKLYPELLEFSIGFIY